MFIEKHQAAAGAKISVTATAAGIFDLINTAASTTLAYAGFSSQVNGIDLAVEDGSIRILIDDNTPTASNGMLLTPGIYFFRNIPLHKMKLIRAGSSNVACSVQLGRCQPGESSATAAAGGGSGASATQIQGNVAAAATDSGNPVKVGGVYNTSKPTYTNGQRGDFQIDVNGNLFTVDAQAPQYEDQTNFVAAMANKPLAVATYAWSIDKSAALEASSVAKAAAGCFRSVSGRIDSTAPSGTYYYQILNHASLPADGAVTLLIAPLKIIHTNGTDSNFTIDATINCVFASTGMVQCLSSTEFTKTISGAYLSTNFLYA